MKKLLLIILLGIGLSISAQQIDYDFRKVYDLSTFTVTKDTTWTFNMSNQYFWGFQFVWTSLDAPDAYILIQTSMDKTNFNDYANLDTLFLNSATGSQSIRDVQKGTLDYRIRIYFKHGTVSSGTLKIYGNIGRKR